MASVVTRRLIRHEPESNVLDLSDEDLLNEYLGAKEPGSQDAFRELVVRHGPMVLGICRHVLDQTHDAEDAFQATFLVLARKGSTIRDRRVLSGWLHEAAYRIAVKMLTSSVRRRVIERQSVTMFAPEIGPDNPGERAAWDELRPVLHEEVNRLPDKYRMPVILCYLEGRTNDEVAALLRWPVGTVKGRLSRARELLRSRLTRRGLVLSAAFLTTSLSRGRVFAEAVPSELVQRTVRLALTPGSTGFPTGSSPAPAGASVESVDFTSAIRPRSLFHKSNKLARYAFLAAVCLLFSLSVVFGSSLALAVKQGNLEDVFSLIPVHWSAQPVHSHCR